MKPTEVLEMNGPQKLIPLEIISWEKLRLKNHDIINFPPESARLHQIWKLSEKKKKRVWLHRGFEPGSPDPKSAMLSTIPWTLSWRKLMRTKDLKCYKSNFQIWWSLALSGGKLMISWFLKRSFSHEIISRTRNKPLIYF